MQFTPEGPLLAVRPCCHTDHYWQVYFDTHQAVVATFAAAGYPVAGIPLPPRNCWLARDGHAKWIDTSSVQWSVGVGIAQVGSWREVSRFSASEIALTQNFDTSAVQGLGSLLGMVKQPQLDL